MPERKLYRESRLVPTQRPSLWARSATAWLRELPLNPEAVTRLEAVYDKGPVVHVLPQENLLGLPFVRYTLDRLNLPPLRWVQGESDASPQALCHTLKDGGSALLFLRRPRTLFSREESYAEDYIEALIDLQRDLKRPIQLLPEAFLRDRGNGSLVPSFWDRIFGTREAPGRFRELAFAAGWRKKMRFHVGSPILVPAVIESEADRPTLTISRRIRYMVRHQLTAERRVQMGPKHRPAHRMRKMVLRDPELIAYIAHKAKNEAERRQLFQKANHLLKQMAADVRENWLRALAKVISLIWKLIYDGIHIDQAGLAEVREAARQGPIVLVPSHKSYIDFLVLSHVFYHEGLNPPHIAAGDNMNFPPIGTVFRRSGAFFIRRSFRGDKLYSTLFGAYVRRLLKEGHPIEFFIEGGRSRTGKLLQPRMGLLSVCAEPVLDHLIPNVHFVPVAISYEKLIEGKAYARELAGGKKKKENMSGLLASTKVLRSRYGRVYLDFAKPVSLRVFAASRGFDLSAGSEPIPKQERRQLIMQLGHRIVYGINLNTRVTPIALAALILLSSPDRGMSAHRLFMRAEELLTYLKDKPAKLSPLMTEPHREAALQEALGRFVSDGLIKEVTAPDGECVYQVGDAGRQALDYYKNSVLHFFLAAAILAAAYHALHQKTEMVHVDALEAAALQVSRLLKFEFSFRQDQSFSDNFEATLRDVVTHRMLDRKTGPDGDYLSITPLGEEELPLIASLIAVFFEAYRLAALTLPKLPEGSTPDDGIPAMRNEAQKLLLEGRVRRSEALSMPLFQAAIKVLSERGIIENALNLKVVDEAARVAFAEELQSYIPKSEG